MISGFSGLKFKIIIAILLVVAYEAVFIFPWPGVSQGKVSFNPNDIFILFFVLIVLLKKEKYTPSFFACKVLRVLGICIAVLLPISISHLADGASIFEFAGYLRNCYAASIMLFVLDYLAMKECTLSSLKILKKNLEDGLLIFGLYILSKILISMFHILLYDQNRFPNIITIHVTEMCLFTLLMPLYWQRIYSKYSGLIMRICFLSHIIIFFPAMLVMGMRLSFVLYFMTAIIMLTLNFKMSFRLLYRIALFLLSLFAVTSSCFFIAQNNSAKFLMIKNMQIISIPFISHIFSIYVATDLHNKNATNNNIDDYSDFTRAKFWHAAIEVIKKKPLLGAGQRMVTLRLKSRDGKYFFDKTPPHNFILETGVLFGLVGIVMLLIFSGTLVVSLLFSSALPVKSKTQQALIFIIFYGYAFFQPTLTSAFITNELFFCLVYLSGIQILMHCKTASFLASQDKRVESSLCTPLRIARDPNGFI